MNVSSWFGSIQSLSKCRIYLYPTIFIFTNPISIIIISKDQIRMFFFSWSEPIHISLIFPLEFEWSQESCNPMELDYIRKAGMFRYIPWLHQWEFDWISSHLKQNSKAVFLSSDWMWIDGKYVILVNFSEWKEINETKNPYRIKSPFLNLLLYKTLIGMWWLSS